MIKASNLKIDFKKNSSKQSLKKNEINILFLNNLNEIKFKPIWLNNEIEKFLINNSKTRKGNQFNSRLSNRAYYSVAFLLASY